MSGGFDAASSGPDDVLRFWFGNEWFDDQERMKTPEYHKERNKLWFMSNDATDAEIRKSFMPLIRAAIAGELTAAEWNTRPGMIAQIVLLDQFTRNAFRGTAESFAGDARSVTLVRTLIEQDCKNLLPQPAVNLLALPLMHSEILADHELLLRQGPLLGIPDAQMQFARGHKDVIDRFGRYPHRNAQHKRESTPEELEWLASPDLPGWARSQLPQ